SGGWTMHSRRRGHAPVSKTSSGRGCRRAAPSGSNCWTSSRDLSVRFGKRPPCPRPQWRWCWWWRSASASSPAAESTLGAAEPPQHRVDADQFASTVGASRQARAGALGSYAGSGFVLAVSGTSVSVVREPSYAITPDRSKLPAPGPTPTDTANAFLAAHGLVPVWAYTVT